MRGGCGNLCTKFTAALPPFISERAVWATRQAAAAAAAAAEDPNPAAAVMSLITSQNLRDPHSQPLSQPRRVSGG